MKKLEYRYSNGTICEHTIYIKPKTIRKECGNLKTVDILEKTTKYEEVAFGSIKPVTRYKYITTLLLN